MIGGGFGGAGCARTLRQLDPKLQVTLVEPNQAFTAFIPSGSAAQFPQAKQYEGRIVSVSGKITLHKGKPEIVVTSPAQVSTR